MAQGYWISPDYNVVDVTNSTHINYIVNNLDIFDYNKKEVEKLFAKFDEKWATEGKAREEIIINVIDNKNWIRVREYNKPDRLKINIKTFDNDETKNILANFASDLINGKIRSKKESGYTTVIIECLSDGNKTIETNLENLIFENYKILDLKIINPDPYSLR